MPKYAFALVQASAAVLLSTNFFQLLARCLVKQPLENFYIPFYEMSASAFRKLIILTERNNAWTLEFGRRHQVCRDGIIKIRLQAVSLSWLCRNNLLMAAYLNCIKVRSNNNFFYVTRNFFSFTSSQQRYLKLVKWTYNRARWFNFMVWGQSVPAPLQKLHSI